MDQSELFSRMGVALAIGLLVGLERGWSKREEEDHSRAAGFRTFALSGLLGGVAALVSVSAGGIVLGLCLLAYAVAFTSFHWLEAAADHDLSATSVVAGLTTFLLGALAVLGDIGVAVGCAIAMTAVLAFRQQLHQWVAALSWGEISSVLILLAMTFLMLPLLPNRTIDPWNSVNPYEIWLLTILIAAVSFAGYVATRILGERVGILLAAVAGGLASSTATTLAFARLARDRPQSTSLLGAGILLAGLTMMARVAGVVLLLNAPLAAQVAGPLAAAAAVLGVAVLILASRQEASGPAMPEVENPLALAGALRMAAVIVVVMVAAGYLRTVFGSFGALLVAAIAGTVDADAIAISMARMAGRGLDAATASQSILLGVAVNTVTKATMAFVVGGRRIGRLVISASVLALLAGAVAFGFQR